MTKKLTILIIAGVMAGIMVVLVVVTHKSPETETGVMSLREAERQVQELKQKIAVPIDKVTREKIDGLISDLSRDHEYTAEINGKKYSVALRAIYDLSKIGRADNYGIWSV